MFKNLRNSFLRHILVVKIFFSIAPKKLFFRVTVNACKNFLHIFTPSSAVLGLTYQCQCQCIHCSAGLYPKDKEKELTKNKWITILDNIYRLGVPRINLTGGEALLRNDVFDIIKYATKKFVVILETNGQLLTQEIIEKLKKSKISCIAVSIDDLNPEKHDKDRNLSNCFQNAFDGISRLTKSGIPCIISTYLTPEKINKE